MVEQVTVNHPVPGSSPGGGVSKKYIMNYQYPLYAPYWKVDLFHKSWYSTLSSLFKMINVKDNEDGSFVIEWDETDEAESIFNDWTKEDFTNFLRWAAEEELSKDSDKSGEESGEDGDTSKEATEKDWEDFWNGPEANKGEGSKLP